MNTGISGFSLVATWQRSTICHKALRAPFG
jgi:hypothetical protein